MNAITVLKSLFRDGRTCRERWDVSYLTSGCKMCILGKGEIRRAHAVINLAEI